MYPRIKGIHYADTSVDVIVCGLKICVQIHPGARQVLCGESAGGVVINACDSPDEIWYPQADSPFLVWLDDAGLAHIAERVREWLAGRSFFIRPDQADGTDVIRIIPDKE